MTEFPVRPHALRERLRRINAQVVVSFPNKAARPKGRRLHLQGHVPAVYGHVWRTLPRSLGVSGALSNLGSEAPVGFRSAGAVPARSGMGPTGGVLRLTVWREGAMGPQRFPHGKPPLVRIRQGSSLLLHPVWNTYTSPDSRAELAGPGPDPHEALCGHAALPQKGGPWAIRHTATASRRYRIPISRRAWRPSP